jgi:2-methylcitrate dehydratase PrpD
LGQSITGQLARYASETTPVALPTEVKERAKKIIFDEVACAYFGRRTTAGALAAQYAVSAGGSCEARIYGTNLRAPAPYAALANGTAGHGEEVDGTHVIGGHPAASIVHAAMALAERQRVPGEELINAVVLAYDVGVRIVQSCGGKFDVRDRLHLTSDFFYAFGATAAACRLLGLDATRHAHAFALVSFQANGLQALYAEKRHISKSFCNGQFAFAGVSAALMSAAGLEGNEDIFGARHGLLDAWGVEGGRDRLTDGLGTAFSIAGANFKFFNAGYPIHTPIEAAMALVKEHRIAADDIETVHVGMPENAMRVVDNRDMHNICVQDMVAASLARGGLALRDLPFPTILADPTYKRLRGSIVVSVDPEIQREYPNGRGARVTIKTRRRESHTLRVDNPLGHSLRGEPSWSDLTEKWSRSLPGCDVESAMSLARELDSVEDVNALGAAFAGEMR